jgi:hypothetical protein
MEHLLAKSQAVHRMSSLTFLPGAPAFHRKQLRISRLSDVGECHRWSLNHMVVSFRYVT